MLRGGRYAFAAPSDSQEPQDASEANHLGFLAGSAAGTGSDDPNMIALMEVAAHNVELKQQLRLVTLELVHLQSQVEKQQMQQQMDRQQQEWKSRYWTAQEHQRFLEALKLHGQKDFKSIAAFVGSRSATQACSPTPSPLLLSCPPSSSFAYMYGVLVLPANTLETARLAQTCTARALTRRAGARCQVKTHAQKYFQKVAKQKQHAPHHGGDGNGSSSGDAVRAGAPGPAGRPTSLASCYPDALLSVPTRRAARRGRAHGTRIARRRGRARARSRAAPGPRARQRAAPARARARNIAGGARVRREIALGQGTCSGALTSEAF